MILKSNSQRLCLAMFAISVSGFVGLFSLSYPLHASSIEISGIYSASLSGNAEIPDVNTQATGEAIFESNAQAAAAGGAAAAASSASRLAYSINVQDIDEVTAAHIHMGRSDENGPIVVTLFDPDIPTGEINGELASGTITAQNLEGPMQGKQLTDLIDLIDVGEAYVNVHTETNPSGEIRGTIQQG
jgi:hypothetical protein